jgi:hypothetical protein
MYQTRDLRCCNGFVNIVGLQHRQTSEDWVGIMEPRLQSNFADAGADIELSSEHWRMIRKITEVRFESVCFLLSPLFRTAVATVQRA